MHIQVPVTLYVLCGASAGITLFPIIIFSQGLFWWCLYLQGLDEVVYAKSESGW